MARTPATTTAHKPASPSVPAPTPAPAPALPAVPGEKRRWLVEVYRVPALEVEADSEEAAWEEFKRLQGIRRTEHRPKIVELGPAPVQQKAEEKSAVVADPESKEG